MATIFTRSYEPAFLPEWEGLDLASAEDCTPRWYGVSFGDGNDGVSHIFADYYVRTADPWTLARAAMYDAVRDLAFARETLDVDGEAEYTITAMLSEGPDGETAYGSAWSLCEVFPVELGDRREADLPATLAHDDCHTENWAKAAYGSIEAAISTVALAAAVEDGGL